MSLQSSERPLVATHDLVMLDLDGVVYRGGDAVPGAAEALGRTVEAGVRLAYLTNNASRPPGVVAEHLRELSMPLHSDEEVVTSAQAVAAVMAGELPAGAPVLVVGGPGLRQALEGVGLRVVSSAEERPAAVVQGFDRSIGWQQLAEASYVIGSGVPWYASNTDRTVPTDRGIAPGNGMLVAAVAEATGRTPAVAGKPYRPLFDVTLERTGATQPLMVGDRLDTDIEGATGLGIAGLWVGTGVHRLADVAAAPAHQRPSYVGADLTVLHRPHPPVEVDGTRAVCGRASAELVDGTVRLEASSDPTSLEAWRAAVDLAWRLVDDGADVPTLDERLDP